MLRLLTLVLLVTLGALAQDDPDARPPVTKADLRIVQRAREILNSPAKWNRADTRKCPPGAKVFSLYCALEEATNEVSGNFAHRGASMQEARFAIEEVAPNRNYEHRLMGYNNDPTTTFEDIQKVLRVLEQRIEKRLAEVPKTDLQILQRARELLDSPSKWNRADTQDCPSEAKTVSLYCALELAGGGAPMAEARRVIGETAANRDKYKARLTDFNNDPATTFADIQKVFQAVEQRLKQRQ